MELIKCLRKNDIRSFTIVVMEYLNTNNFVLILFFFSFISLSDNKEAHDTAVT